MQTINMVLDYLRDYSWVTVIIRLTLSAVLGATIGFEREKHGRAAGLRTHTLVAIGSAVATLIGHYNIEVMNFTADPMRIGAQVLSGIGFLGAGTIISKGRFQVTGLTTAAGLWATASIGLATGIGFYEAAIVGTLLVSLTMSLLTKFDSTIIKNSRKIRTYIEIDNVANMHKVIDKLEADFGGGGIQVTVPRSGVAGNAGIECTLHVANEKLGKQVISQVNELEHVVFALPSI